MKVYQPLETHQRALKVGKRVVRVKHLLKVAESLLRHLQGKVSKTLNVFSWKMFPDMIQENWTKLY
jgi:hypothetical protein